MNIFSVLAVNEGDEDNVPDPVVPYYAIYKEGVFLHRKTQIGNVLVRQTSLPTNATLAKLGNANGVFQWTGEKIPGKIIAQATDFFTRIYDAHGTEAEVIITMHNDTGEFRLFVPYQRVSGTGVKSLFDAAHIDKNYTVVGSIHSHCNFGAFHSGTDSADAADMDGIHFTIGMLKSNPPQIVAMAVMNKKEFHYSDPNMVADVVFTGETAPEWWDRYVFPGTTPDTKPKGMKTTTQHQWDVFKGTIPQHVAKTPTPITTPKNYGRYMPMDTDWENPWGDYVTRMLNRQPNREQRKHPHPQQQVIPFQPTTESRLFNQKKKRSRAVEFNQTPEQLAIDSMIDEAMKQDVIVASDWLLIDAEEMDNITTWRELLLNKLDTICDILEMVNVEITYVAKEATA